LLLEIMCDGGEKEESLFVGVKNPEVLISWFVRTGINKALHFPELRYDSSITGGW